MAKKLQILRGTTAQNDAYTGSIGELTMDTEKVEVRIHDGTTKGGKTIGSGGGASLPILTNIWSDHLLNDMSWLRADTFSWQSGDVYVAAYEHLLNDYDSSDFEEAVWGYNEGRHIDVYTKTGNPQIGTTVYDTDIGEEVGTVSALGDDYIDVAVYGGTERFYRARNFDKMSHSDTIGDITIRYALGADGHKICLPDQESNIVALYEATGVAWYYILDTANKQFKLPRTKWGFTGLRDSVGGYVAQDVLLPNITGVVTGIGDVSVSGAFARGSKVSGNGGGGGSITADSFKASRSSSVYSGDGTNTLIQPRGTQMYLYFYVGNFEQSAIEQTAGITAETLNNKLDIGAGNATDETKATIVGWGMPDYSAGVVVADGYQTTFPCFITLIHPAVSASNSAVVINIDGVRVVLNVAGGNVSKRLGTSCYVGTGHTITIDGSDGSPVLTVYPLKGVN